MYFFYLSYFVTKGVYYKYVGSTYQILKTCLIQKYGFSDNFIMGEGCPLIIMSLN